jgi:hypothetical protein
VVVGPVPKPKPKVDMTVRGQQVQLPSPGEQTLPIVCSVLSDEIKRKEAPSYSKIKLESKK